MFHQNQPIAVPANVMRVLKKLEQQEKQSNKKYERVKRCISQLQHPLCAIPDIVEEVLVNENGVLEKAPFIQYSEECRNAKEPTLYALAKQDEAWLRIAES